jgi:hypothetical protein
MIMKYKIVHKNKKEKIINCSSLEEAQTKADDIWKEWEDIYELDYLKEYNKKIGKKS